MAPEKTLIIPENYRSYLPLKETQLAIKLVKDTFERNLAQALNLTRVSAPIFVRPETGLNDYLNGTERPVSFDFGCGGTAEIVQSLAKWKRAALRNYGFGPGEGLYTDMNAIRRDEQPDNLHSFYVDQWDWEMTITDKQYTEDFLRETVSKIYRALTETQRIFTQRYPQVPAMAYNRETPFFITSQQLEDRWPHLSGRERENEITRRHKAVFLMKIGDTLKSGNRHDGRSPDYDNWQLNGDLILWNDVLGRSVELSSMGIRVDGDTLVRQLEKAGSMDRMAMTYHRELRENKLPLSIGGGIGQSRICMFLLAKAHIGEVQASLWPKEMIEDCEKHGIHLL